MVSSSDGIIERAFHLAKAGECETLGDVAKKLKAEGFGAGLIERHFDGLTIRTQIGDLCKKARTQADISGWAEGSPTADNLIEAVQRPTAECRLWLISLLSGRDEAGTYARAVVEITRRDHPADTIEMTLRAPASHYDPLAEIVERSRVQILELLRGAVDRLERETAETLIYSRE